MRRDPRSVIFPARNLPTSTLFELPTTRQLALSAMQIWRRTFATSVARLGSNQSTSTRPVILRCAQILQDSKKDRPCSIENQEISINGFIRSVRKQKRFAFAELSDGSTIQPLQAILKPEQAAEYVNRENYDSLPPYR